MSDEKSAEQEMEQAPAAEDAGVEGVQQAPEADPVSEVIADPVPDPVETAIGKWINGHLTNSPLAQATEAWNHVMGSLNALRTYLKEELGKG